MKRYWIAHVERAKRLLLTFSHLLWWASFILSLLYFIVPKWYEYQLLQYGQYIPKITTNIHYATSYDIGMLHRLHDYESYYYGFMLLLASISCVTAISMGVLLYHFGRKDLVCLFASMTLLVINTACTVDPYSLRENPELYNLMYVLGGLSPVFLSFLFLFPGGSFSPRWTKLPSLIWSVLTVVCCFLFPDSPLNFLKWDIRVMVPFLMIMHLLVIYAQYYRYTHASSPKLRRYLRWFLFSLVIHAAGIVLLVSQNAFDLPLNRGLSLIIMYSGMISWPFGFGVAVLESRINHLTSQFNRMIVAGTVNTMIMAAYVVIVGAIGLVLLRDEYTLLNLVLTGMVALLLHSVRLKLHKGVNELVYGQREEPYAILSNLTRQMETVLANQSVLPVILEGVAQALDLTYVEIVMADEGTTKHRIIHGKPTSQTCQLPLIMQGEKIGLLVLGTNNLSNTLPPDKYYLLEDLVRQVAVTVHTDQLARELQKSRERLIHVREEERRRLRRDFHDGLGSILSSIPLRLDMVLNQPAASQNFSEILTEIKADVKEALGNIRSLVYALRPPTLDEFGLLYALRDMAKKFESDRMHVTISAVEPIGPLHAAIEVAVYRIVQEGMTNIIRHAGATQCVITLHSRNQMLLLEIEDNGSGLPDHYLTGVGIRSMKERAEELGGTFAIESFPEIGTRIMVTFPLKEFAYDIHTYSKD
ncbi:MAG: sensor histidine kinase [Clostridia bacterium]